MKKSIISLAFLAAIAVLISCNKNKSAPSANANVSVTPVLPDATAKYFSDNGNVNGDVDILNKKATLGRVLFYDNHLSLNNATACASCHHQALAFSDNAAFSRGFENKQTARNTPPIQNLLGSSLKFFTVNGKLTGASSLFWDGRENNLQDLILRPVSNHVEMGMEQLEDLPAKLGELPYYNKLFKDAYGSEDVTLDRISESIGLFIGSINSQGSRFDQFIAGKTQLTALENYGFTLFNTKYPCGSCHHVSMPGGYGGMGTGSEFMDIGLDIVSADKGRAAITGNAADNGRFKIPNLHNIALTAPYMHDGRFNTLGEVIDHYSAGIQNTANLNDELKDVNGKAMRMNISTEEKAALIAFLQTMTDNDMITDPKFSDPFKTN